MTTILIFAALGAVFGLAMQPAGVTPGERPTEAQFEAHLRRKGLVR